MTDEVFRIWSPTSRQGALGYEVLGPPLTSHQVGPTLSLLDRRRVADGAFLLLPLAKTDRRGMQVAIEMAKAASMVPRICLAVDAETIKYIDSELLADGQVGFLLDHLSADTPPSAVICDALEAIRFDARFIEHARLSLRVDAAMRSMIGLAQDLCLSTLAFVDCEKENSATLNAGLDYVARSPAAQTGERPGSDGRAQQMVATGRHARG